MDDPIVSQVNGSPLTKEESRAQFVAMTDRFGLKHSFDFDEAWDIGIELRKRRDFREKITEFERRASELKQAMSGDELNRVNPVKHTFAGGCYIREIFNPAHELIITKIHKKEHPFFLLSGEMSILTEDGVKRIKAPYYGVTRPGTKRIIFTHSDCIFVTVHATNLTDIEKIEEEVIASGFDDPAITLEDMKLLEGK